MPTRPDDRRMEELAARLGLGPTGRSPERPVSPDDQGELRAAVGVEGDQVVIHFGRPVAWVSLGADGAEYLARLLLEKAAAARQPGGN